MWSSDIVADDEEIHSAYDYTYEDEFLIVQRGYDGSQVQYEVPVYAAIEQEIGLEANSCWLIHADREHLYISFQCGVDENDWIRGAARYNKQTGVTDILGSFSCQSYAVFEISLGVDAILAYPIDYEEGAQPYHIIRF